MSDFFFKGKYLLRAELHCVTGLHIGGTSTGIEIGGMDNPVLKDPLTEMPYAPGSSLKGKLRALLEWSKGLIGENRNHQNSYVAYACEELMKPKAEAADKARWDQALSIARLFGPATNEAQVRKTAGPSRLTVRDAMPTEKTRKEWEQKLGEGVYTEVKTENALDRLTSEANPRPMERVPAGSSFGAELIVDVYSMDPQGGRELLEDLFAGLLLLEQSALGGSGSRGSGQVRFQKLGLEWRPLSYYRGGGKIETIALGGDASAEAARDSLRAMKTLPSEQQG